MIASKMLNVSNDNGGRVKSFEALNGRVTHLPGSSLFKRSELVGPDFVRNTSGCAARACFWREDYDVAAGERIFVEPLQYACEYFALLRWCGVITDDRLNPVVRPQDTRIVRGKFSEKV